MKRAIVSSVLAFACAASARAGIVITEVDPAGNDASGYAADWFELTNTGASAVNITGWSMDDDSHTAGTAPFAGVSSIAAGQSAVFIDGSAAGTPTTDATLIANFETNWFGTTVPVGFTIGTYHGSGVGLGASGDEVNVFDGSNTSVTGVAWKSSLIGLTLDNSVTQLGGTTASARPDLSVNSVVGTGGAFLAPDGEIGSPGTIGAVTPEPASLSVVGIGAMSLLSRRRKIAR